MWKSLSTGALSSKCDFSKSIYSTPYNFDRLYFGLILKVTSAPLNYLHRIYNEEMSETEAE